jgi:hypothetical protein
MTLEIAFAAVYVIQTAVSAWSLVQVRRFVLETPAISDSVALARYKDFVRVQMYLALATIAILLPGIVLATALIVRHGLSGLLVVLVVNAWVFAVGRYHKRWEMRARGLPAGSDVLGEEYRRVSETWVKRPLPDF